MKEKNRKVIKNRSQNANGILTKATTASNQTKISQIEEEIKLNVLENEMKKYSKDKNEVLSYEKLKVQIEEKLTKLGYKIEDGKIFVGETEINIAEEIKKYIKEIEEENTMKDFTISISDITRNSAKLTIEKNSDTIKEYRVYLNEEYKTTFYDNERSN